MSKNVRDDATERMTPEIAWLQQPEPLACRVCEWSGTGSLIARITALGQVSLPLVKCPACASIQLIDSPLASSPDDVSVDGYVEAGAGIGTIVECLEAVDPGGIRRFLDIGCNYGFALDAARFLYGWDVVGVEPSLAGRRGAVELGLDIRHEYLTDGTDLGGDFDLILASEVLEHVPDPLAFLQLASRRLSPTGTLVLTTPAAEIIAPEHAQSDVLTAASPGYHVFLASRDGLEQLLRRAGFAAVRVTRRHGTLRAAASLDPAAGVRFRAVVPGVSDRLLPYYDWRAGSSPPESALAGGMAIRHLRGLVARGMFGEAEASAARVCRAFALRHGIDLLDPAGGAREIAARGAAPWSLGGAAFALGMLELLHRGKPAPAAALFELASQAIAAWTREAQVADLDSVDLRFQAPYHRALALARVDPAAAAAAALGLTAYASRSSTPPETVAARQCRVYVELVAGGHYDAAGELAPIVEASARRLARSGQADARMAGLDSLFSLGIVAVNTGRGSAAHVWFAECARLCEAWPASDPHAAGLAPVAREHAGRTARFAESASRPVAAAPISTHHNIDVYWCDPSGTFLEGWVHAERHAVRSVTARVGDRSTTVDVFARPDLAAFWPDVPEVTMSGFTAYVAGPPHAAVSLIAHTAAGDVPVELSLPGYALPVLEELELTDAASSLIKSSVRLAPDGPVLTVGMRSASAGRLADAMAPFEGRRVFNVDIHGGLGVDVIADAHRLSRTLRPGHFAVAASFMVLEHVSVPWLVAAELARLLKPGGLAIHFAPWVFPTHATPSDYWRFSPEGLTQLFGPETGFEILAKGSGSSVVVTPLPGWRPDSLKMATTSSASAAWIVARKVRDCYDEIRWPYDPSRGARLARQYPVGGLVPPLTGAAT